MSDWLWLLVIALGIRAGAEAFGSSDKHPRYRRAVNVTLLISAAIAISEL